jgi:hypothetical protein
MAVASTSLLSGKNFTPRSKPLLRCPAQVPMSRQIGQVAGLLPAGLTFGGFGVYQDLVQILAISYGPALLREGTFS